MWSSTPLKTVNNYSIRIAKNTDNVVLLSLLLISEFIHSANYSGEFHVVKHFEIEILIISCLIVYYFKIM